MKYGNKSRVNDCISFLVKKLKETLKEKIQTYNELYSDGERKLLKEPKFDKPASWVGYERNDSFEKLKKGELFCFILHDTGKRICTKTVRLLVADQKKFLLRKNTHGNTFDALCEFIGESAWEKFQRKYYSAFESDRSLPYQLYNASETTIILLGFYFSIQSFNIRKVILALFPKTLEDSNKDYEAKLWGFHSFEKKIDLKLMEYKGGARLRGKYLYINLLRLEGEKEMNITLSLPEGSISKNKYKLVNGSCQAILENNTKGGMLNLGLLFKRINKSQVQKFDIEKWSLEKSQILDVPTVEHIKSYLSVRLNNFRVGSRSLSSYKSLDTINNPLQNIIDLAGCYKLVNIGKKENNVVFSKFTIEPNGKAFLEPPIDSINVQRNEIIEQVKLDQYPNWEAPMKELNLLRKQPSILYPTGFEEMNTVVAMTFTSKLKPVITAIFNGQNLKKDGFVIGTFITIVYNEENDPYTEYFLMKKSEDFVPESKTIDQLNSEELKELSMLSSLLKEIWYIKDVSF